MDITANAQQLGHRTRNSDWLDNGVRVGLAAYGLVHLLIAWLALKLAMDGGSGKAANSKGALQELASTGVGRLSLYVVAAGLFALVVWQGLEAAAGHRAEDGGKRAFKRSASAAKAVIYAGVGLSALKTATGTHSKSKGTDGMTARLMSMPFGQLLVGLVGVVILAVAVYLARRGWKEKFLKRLDGKGQTGHDGRAYRMFGKVGYIAKGVALAIVGLLFVWAAVTHDAKKSGGLDQALHRLLTAPFGPVLLAAVAAGIACYGLFCFAWAKHLRR
jgi:hypothetical protein